MAKTNTCRFITRVRFISFGEKIKFNFDLFSRDLAIAIHNDERRQVHEAQLRQRQAQGYYNEQSSRKSKKKSHKSYRDDDYDSGCILS
jgi:hypothetical protein